MDVWDKIKRVGVYVIVAVFWIAVAFTFLGGCFGTFFKSSSDQNDDYEEYFQENIP